jgi:hypothetical protein
VIDVSETLHSQRERGRVHAQGRRTDDRSHCTLLVIHGLGAPGVRLTVLSSRRTAGSPVVDGADHG